MLDVRVFHVDDGARPVFHPAHLELAFDDVPDLREVVLVQREAGARLVAQEADVRRRRPPGRRMEQELGDVPEAADLPLHLVGMLELRGVMHGVLLCYVAGTSTRRPTWPWPRCSSI